MISRVFGFALLNKLSFGISALVLLSGQGDANTERSLFGNTCQKTLRRQLDRCQEISIGLRQIRRTANATLASHTPSSRV